MESKFKDRKANIITIDPAGSIRQLLADTLKEKGFSSVQSVASLKDALGVIEVESVDWIITPTLINSETNAFQLLQLLINQPLLNHIKVTFLLDEGEERFLSYAFEQGLLNYIDKPSNKSAVDETFDAMIKEFESENWDMVRISARNLLRFLEKKNGFIAKEDFLKRLIKLYPGDTNYFLELAKTYFMLKKFAAAKSLLKQAVIIAPDRKAEIEKISEDLFANKEIYAESEDNKSEEKNNFTGLNSCFVVDPDDETKKTLTTLISDLGIPNIISFVDGESAWNAIDSQATPPDIVFYEWSIPKLSGPYLTQRIKYKSPSTLLIVVSGSITESDIPLIKEMGLSLIVQKPINSTEFSKQIVSFFQTSNFPTSTAEAMESKLIHYLESGQNKKALSLRYNYDKLPKEEKKQRDWIESQFAFIEEKYEIARDLALNAVGSYTNTISLLNFLSKCLIKLNDYENALKCLEKAQALSPMNLERLCTLAEIKSELGQEKEADKDLANAKSQDPNSAQVKESEVKLEVQRGNTEAAKQLMDDLGSLSKLISHMNNKAVSYARGGKIDESFDLYKNTINSIPEKRREVKSIVQYNLALAFTRANKINDAETAVDSVIGLGESKVLNKAKSLKLKLNKAKESGKPIELRTTEEGTNEGKSMSEAIHSRLVTSLSLSPGDICCYLLYKDIETHPDEVKNLTSIPLHYKERNAIEKRTE